MKFTNIDLLRLTFFRFLLYLSLMHSIQLHQFYDVHAWIKYSGREISAGVYTYAQPFAPVKKEGLKGKNNMIRCCFLREDYRDIPLVSQGKIMTDYRHHRLTCRRLCRIFCCTDLLFRYKSIGKSVCVSNLYDIPVLHFSLTAKPCFAKVSHGKSESLSSQRPPENGEKWLPWKMILNKAFLPV